MKENADYVLDTEAHDLQVSLKDNIQNHMGARASSYAMEYKDDQGDEHHEFLRNFADDVCRKLAADIMGVFQQNHISVHEVLTEVLYHYEFVIERSTSFVGKRQALYEIWKACSENLPVVVWGASGCGKTSIMAKIVQTAKIENPKRVVVYRFVGITPGSSDMRSLLASICKQLYLIYTKEIPALPDNDLEKMIASFAECVNKVLDPETAPPLLVVVDSLDQFLGETVHAWLPNSLHKKLHFIVSTIPGPWLEYFRTDISKEYLYEVQPLFSEEGTEILESSLARANRKLTYQQSSAIMNLFDQCSSPLFLKLCLNRALKWRSFTPVPPDFTQASTVNKMITLMFQKLENVHGKIFTSRMLGLITATKEGISITELEDILSCDEEVLVSIYEWWTPPIRRVPSLLCKRLLYDLEGFLVVKGSNGVSTYGWYHRQFWEAAEGRYLDKPNKHAIHKALANYFSDKNGIPIPYFDKTTFSSASCLRFVSPQPYMHKGGSVNCRKIAELPYHLEQLGNATELAQLLCDLRFIQASFAASKQFDLLLYYEKAIELCAKDDALTLRLQDHQELVFKNQLYLADFPDRIFQQAANTDTESCIKNSESYVSDLTYNWLSVINKASIRDVVKYEFKKHSNYVINIAIHGDKLASIEFKTVFIWSINTGKCLRKLDNTLGKGTNLKPDFTAAVQFSPDGTLLVSTFETITPHEALFHLCTLHVLFLFY
eukprot:Phypoly_transcript_00312.p2 GENE.Phypoly_transcript_00312~~Phypoly_transcript_00312.p2  ORF type:complete len:831 (+),score=86.13 Phypoly_transcript_00312:342-2495(+)